MGIFSSFIDPGKVGGWVRAATASILTILVGKLALKIPVVAQFVTPDMILGLAAAVGTLVTGLLSSKSKS